MRRGTPVILIALIGLVLTGRSAMAAQILISPGQKWDDQARFARPGDEIILMPGYHRDGVLENIRGTPENPLVIRGLNAENPAIIRGSRYGVRLVRCRNVVFKHVIVENAEINGFLIDGSGSDRPVPGAADPTEEPANIRLINVLVRDTGEAKHKRNAIELHRVGHVTLESCHVEGWGGVGVEIVGCANVIVEKCTIRGTGAYQPVAGLRARAGSSDITVAHCRFENAGISGVCAGGASELKDFRIGVLENAVKASIFEVRQITIERNFFVGGACAITLTHSDRVTVTRNTIIEPGYYVFCLVQTQDNSQIGPTRRCTFSRNLVTWKAGAMASLFLIDKGVEVASLKMEQNLWWSAESATDRARLGQVPQSERSPQQFNVDPRLDRELAPTALEANGFGALPVRVPDTGPVRNQ